MDPSTWTYEIEDTTLTWTSNAQVLNYALYIIDEPEPFIVTEAGLCRLKNIWWVIFRGNTNVC